MIVKCARCQTRFKIPDEKVTDKGVKVRCTKCQNTFRVTREPGGEDAGASSPPSSAGQADPFAEFGVAPDPKGVEVTRPGFFAQGVAATRALSGSPSSSENPSWNSMDGELDTEDGVFREPTRIGPMPRPPLQASGAPGVAAARNGGAVPLPAPPEAIRPPVDTSTGLYGGAVPPPVEDGAPMPAGAVPLPGFAPSSPRAGPGVASPRSAPPGGMAARAMPPPPPPAALRQGGGAVPPPPPGSGALAGSASPPAPDADDPFADFLSAPMPGGAQDPFDALPAPVTGPSIADRRPSAPGARAVPPAPPAVEDDPFASIDIDDSTMVGSPPAQAAPVASAPPSVEDDPFASIDIDDSTMAGQPSFSPVAPASRGAPPSAPAARGGAGAPSGARAPSAGGSAPHAAPAGAAVAAPRAASVGAPVAAPRLAPAGAPVAASAPPAAPTGASVGASAPRAVSAGAPLTAPPARAAQPGASFTGPDDATQAGRPPHQGAAPSARAALFSGPEDATVPGRPPLQSAPGGPDPFGALDLGDATMPGRPPLQSAPGGADPFGALDLGDATMPGRPPHPAAGAGFESPSAPPAGAQDLFDLSSDGDFGEHAGLQPSDTGRAALFGTSSQGALGLDDSQAHSTGSLLDDVPPPEESLDFGGVTLGRIGGAGVGQREVLELDPQMSAAPVVSVAKPTARPEDVGIPQARPPSRARKVTALLVNLMVAAALVVGLGAVGSVYLSEGRLDLSVLSPENLRALVVPAPKPLVALDVSNGLFETQAGRPLFFIRGDAENRTASATHVRVRGALFDGDQRVRSVEGLAGLVATPEELHAVGNAEAAQALRKRLDAGAVSVAPGARVPFLLVFHEYPAALGSFRLEVTVEAVPPPAEAAPAPTEAAPPQAPAQAAPTE
ncbi:zinc-ribbon domain-containing protein [Myxococcus sp. CA033]|uniref:zinc-ribbon domain-containing protein n=2 Tax=unclassified Myxococcus TaxID=2648731 RepID=UPI00157B47ED|nr:zinc-ribbon domain-containing protein [Myxococcus sp. CA033]NTX33760.1 zinc-ribbon domain-containing protein [Myxococcus sp. CA033]